METDELLKKAVLTECAVLTAVVVPEVEGRKGNYRFPEVTSAGLQKLNQRHANAVAACKSKLAKEAASVNGVLDLITTYLLYPYPKSACPFFANDINPEAKKKAAEYQFFKAKTIYLRATHPTRRARFSWRNRWLEIAISILRHLTTLEPIAAPWQANFLLAQCYYERALNILPIAGGVPPLKLDALTKALKHLKEAIKEARDAEADTSPLLVKHAEILCELYVIYPEEYKDGLCEALNKAVPQSSDFTPGTMAEVILLDQYCVLRACSDDKKLSAYNRAILDFKDPPKKLLHPQNLPLLRARAALRLLPEDNESILPNVVEYTGMAVAELKYFALYYRCWDDVLVLLKALKARDADGWRECAICAWLLCEEQARESSFGVQIRQYWSRLQELYNIALEATLELDDLEAAVAVVDSLKGRTVQAWQKAVAVLARENKGTADDLAEKFERYFNGERLSRNQRFVPELREMQDAIKDVPPKDDPPKSSSRPLADIPAGWAAVHLHLVTTNTGLAGRAFIKTNSALNWAKIDLPSVAIADVQKKYEAWLNAYRNSPSDARERSGQQLISLCDAIGTTIAIPVVEKIKAIDDKVTGIIWVPHGLAHKLPLHAAKLNNEKYLFQDYASAYLPAWSFTRMPQDTAITTEGDYCLRSFTAPKEKEYMSEILNRYENNQKYDPADKGHLASLAKQFREKPPKSLAILCHGAAHETDPFQARLMLGKDGITFMELHCLNLHLAGTRVYLGACDTELTPLSQAAVDEHLSLAGIFLAQSCAEVLGAFWELKIPMAEEIIVEGMAGNKPVWQLIQEKQQGWLKDKTPSFWSNYYRAQFSSLSTVQQLHIIAPFKAIGYPTPISSPVKDTGCTTPTHE